MKNFFVCLALLVSVITTQAAAPSDKSIETLLGVMHVQAMLDQMLNQMDNGMQQGLEQGLKESLKGKGPSAAQKAKIDEFQKKVSGIIKEDLSYSKTKDVYFQVYREVFTQDEVNSIIAFYSSPAGKAMVEKVPVAMQKAGALVQERIAPMAQKLQAMMEDFRKDIEKIK